VEVIATKQSGTPPRVRVALDPEIPPKVAEPVFGPLANQTYNFFVFECLVASMHHAPKPRNLSVLNRKSKVRSRAYSAELVVASQRD
jgi:hypothetical protein